MVPTKRTTVIADGIARLTSAFTHKPVITGILKSALSSVQDLENVIWTVIYSKLITANPPPSGDALDKLGAIVGETRNGRTDATYFPAVLLRIRVNKSRGLAEDIIQISNTVNPAVYTDQYGTAAWLLETWDLTVDVNAYLKMLSDAKAAGVRGVVHFSTWAPYTLPFPYFTNLVMTSAYGFPGGVFPALPSLLKSTLSDVGGQGLLVSARDI